MGRGGAKIRYTPRNLRPRDNGDSIKHLGGQAQAGRGQELIPAARGAATAHLLPTRRTRGASAAARQGAARR